MTQVSTTNKPTKKRSFAPAKVGLSGIEDLDPRITVVKETASVIPWLIKFTIVLGVGYYAYRSFTNRFVKKKEVSNFPKANITDDQAKSRAGVIYDARSFAGISDDQYNLTSQQLAGLNYNGFIKLYNAFGHRNSYFLSGDMDLIEFLQDQFTDTHLQELSTLLNGAFFKGEPSQEQLAIQYEFFPSIYLEL